MYYSQPGFLCATNLIKLLVILNEIKAHIDIEPLERFFEFSPYLEGIKVGGNEVNLVFFFADDIFFLSQPFRDAPVLFNL